MKLPLEEKKLMNKSELLDDLAMAMGGRAAEKIIFGEITTGASGDIESSTRIARNMVMRWGMSESLGPIAFAEDELTNRKEYSHDIARKIDDEVSEIIKAALVRAEETLTKYRGALDAVAKKLLEVETLEQDEYNKLIKPFGLIGKVKEA